MYIMEGLLSVSFCSKVAQQIGCYFWNNRDKIIKKVLKKRRSGVGWISAILLPSHCGKSTLAKLLSNTSSNGVNVLVIDVDEALKMEIDMIKEQKLRHLQTNQLRDVYKINYYKLVKKWYDELLKDYKKTHRIVLLLSDKGLCDFLEIADIVPCVPESDFLETQILPTCADDETKRKVKSEWLELIQNIEKEELSVFRKWDHLEELIRNSFGIKYHL
jgi:hypothetical protein